MIPSWGFGITLLVLILLESVVFFKYVLPWSDRQYYTSQLRSIVSFAYGVPTVAADSCKVDLLPYSMVIHTTNS